MLSIPVFELSQPVGTFFIGVMRADHLFSICSFDYRRMQYNNGYVDFLGIQRELNAKRISEIKQYVKTADACFPTSIVISIDEKCARIEETDIVGAKILKIFEYVDEQTPELSIKLDEVASIIDGQHRLKGLEEANSNEFEVPVSIFIGPDDATEAMIFSIVNLAQTKVNKSLVYDLFSLATSRSPEKTCHEIVVALDRMEESPFQNRIKRLGVATEGRFGETLSQATIVKGLLPYITNDPVTDRDRGKRFGFWDPSLARDQRRRIFYEFFRRNDDASILNIVLNYFNAIKERWPAAWAATGTGNIINRTNGYNGFIRFLRPAYLYFTTEPKVVAKDSFASLFNRVNLSDADFNPARFLPGSSGSTSLYNILLEQSGIPKA
ncbi:MULTISPECIES: DGQHR domain-containing protein [unclassified Bradyrhizobium]|uniref:DGQHR domain-containing protein n=1 Tax=unclassified Bradyrhizobium TaxID=2631580 RepID=UPI0028E49669|nr:MULTISPECIES: DGQHR domain-containing protein [unclassified Bradyrhizobium]